MPLVPHHEAQGRVLPCEIPHTGWPRSAETCCLRPPDRTWSCTSWPFEASRACCHHQEVLLGALTLPCHVLGRVLVRQWVGLVDASRGKPLFAAVSRQYGGVVLTLLRHVLPQPLANRGILRQAPVGPSHCRTSTQPRTWQGSAKDGLQTTRAVRTRSAAGLGSFSCSRPIFGAWLSPRLQPPSWFVLVRPRQRTVLASGRSGAGSQRTRCAAPRLRPAERQYVL